MTIVLLTMALAVFIINIPFGYWRATTKKFSFYWFVAIHSPVPLIVAMRYFGEIGHDWYTYAIFVPLFFLGQRTGTQLWKVKQYKA